MLLSGRGGLLGRKAGKVAFDTVASLIREMDGDFIFSRQGESPNRGCGFWQERDILRELIPVLPPLLRATAERAIKPGAGPMRRWRDWMGPELPYTGGGDPPAELIWGEPKQVAA